MRIARFWKHLDARKNNELIRYQFVMLDEKMHYVMLSTTAARFYVYLQCPCYFIPCCFFPTGARGSLVALLAVDVSIRITLT